MLVKDQEIRTSGVTSQEFNSVDSLNINRLIEITQEYGWQDNGWLILWHQRGTYKEDEAKSLIIQSIIETNASKNYFLNFKEFDRFRHLDLFREIERNYDSHIAEFYKNLKHPNIS